VFILFVIYTFAAVSDGATTTASYLSTSDRARLKQVLNSAWELKDLASVHFAVLGFKLLGEAIPKQQVRVLNIDFTLH
jgi:Oligosaccharyltransferase subunit Ribophorin II.